MSGPLCCKIQKLSASATFSWFRFSWGKNRRVWRWRAVSCRQGDRNHPRCLDSSLVFHGQHVKETQLWQTFLPFPSIRRKLQEWSSKMKKEQKLDSSNILFLCRTMSQSSNVAEEGPTGFFLPLFHEIFRTYLSPMKWDQNNFYSTYSSGYGDGQMR